LLRHFVSVYDVIDFLRFEVGSLYVYLLWEISDRCLFVCVVVAYVMMCVTNNVGGPRTRTKAFGPLLTQLCCLDPDICTGTSTGGHCFFCVSFEIALHYCI